MDTLSASVLLNRLHARGRIRHLQAFVKLAQLGNLKRTAEALSLSQPAVTQLLAELERLMEVKLFDRHSRGARITVVGNALLPSARRVLEALADSSELITSIKRQGEGVVRIAAITGGISGLLVRALPEFGSLHPGVQVHVQESDADQCLLQLTRREVDLALNREPVVLPVACHFTPLIADHFAVACGLTHPLLARRKISWASLARERWLLSPVESAARRMFDAQMASVGSQPPTGSVITRVSGLTWAFLQAGKLLTLVPYSVVRQLVEANQLALLDVEPVLPFSPIGMVVPVEGSSQATRMLADFLVQFAEKAALTSVG